MYIDVCPSQFAVSAVDGEGEDDTLLTIFQVVVGAGVVVAAW
jgi:hypothetical protein